MSKILSMVNRSVRRWIAASAISSAALALIAFPSIAVAEDVFCWATYSEDVFSEVLTDLNLIKEVAFTKPSSNCHINQSRGENCAVASQCCGNCSQPAANADGLAAVCPHVAHPDSCPLAYSHDVRNSDVIPPVPNIEDYATPDDEAEETFVDEDMINKLQGDKVSMEKGIENYCGQMANLLSDTLRSPQLDAAQQTAAIKSAMQLAVVNAQIAAEAKIAQMKAAHQSEMAIMRGRLLQYSYIESNQQKLYQWLSPIYSNVDRNFKQIQKMSEGSTQIKNGLHSLQSQLANQGSARYDAAPNDAGRNQKPKNQLIVTRHSKPAQRIATTADVNATKRFQNRSLRPTAGRPSPTDPITLLDFQILEQRLQNAERLIAGLTSHAQQSYDASGISSERSEATHRRVSYDRLMPIQPLHPQR